MSATPTDEVDTVVVFPSGERLHLPDDEGPLCSAPNPRYREKPIDVYPEAHRQWCAVCLDLFEERKRIGFYS